jgi:8-amino-7-oxononanoate synthase
VLIELAAPQTNGSFFGPHTLVELLRHRALYQPGDRAFTYLVDGEGQEQHLSYAELDRQARLIAARLLAAGATGERVLLLYPAGLQYIAALFGCLYAGAVAVPAYPPRMNRTLERLSAIAADADARFALATGAIVRQVGQAGEEVNHLRALEWLTTDDLADQVGQWNAPAIGRDTLAILQYTSGSTGTPKGVMLTHANLLHNSALIAHAFEHTRSGVGVFWLPGYHDMGLIGGILQPLYVGRPNVLMSPMAFLQKPLRWLEAISRFGATTSGGPNFAYDLCVRKVSQEDLQRLDLSRWRVAFNGAEPVRAETLKAFAERFAPCGFRREAFYPCYGLAEATLLATGGQVDQPPVIRLVDARALERHSIHEVTAEASHGRAVVGCGRSLPDQEVRIVDPRRLGPCGDGQIGEIWLRGPSVSLGYWRRPTETAETFGARFVEGGAEPYLRTGDLGFLRDGELFVTGRLKDLIIIRGQNHYAQNIEATAERSHAALAGMAGAAFAVDVGGEQRLVVVQEIQRGRRAEAEAALLALRREVVAHHDVVPAEIALVLPGRIPKTTSGKVQRHACRQAFLTGRLKPIANWSDKSWKTAVSTHAAIPEETCPPQQNPQECAANGATQRATEPTSQRTVRAPSSTRGTRRSPSGELRLHTPPGRWANSQQDDAALREQVLAEVRQLSRPLGAGLSLDSTLAEAGIDSLGRMELLAVLEGRFQVRLPESLGSQVQTIKDVVLAVRHYVVRSLPSPSGESRAERAAVENIPAEHYEVAKFPEWIALRRDAQRLEVLGASNPYFQVQEVLPGRRVRVDGRELIDFASYDYLGLVAEPRVVAAAQRAVERHGTSVSGSRLVSGERSLHRELEQQLARWLGAEEALTFVSGHATNVTTLGHLLGPGDLIVHDALAHSSIVQGCRLSGARRLAFPHNDADALDRLLTNLRGHYRRALVAIEGLYSMDGDVPNLPRFVEVKRRHKALLLVDEAHSLGVLGQTGRGIGEHCEAAPADVDLWMGTLSKALASCGGYIAGRRELVQYLKYTAPGFVYSVGMSPANAAAALEALRVLELEPRRVQTLQKRAESFVRLAKRHGLDLGSCHDGPIVPILVGDAPRCLRLWQALVERGILAQPILPPAVPAASSRLRFFVTAAHSAQQVSRAVQVLAEEFSKLTRDVHPAAAS